MSFSTCILRNVSEQSQRPGSQPAKSPVMRFVTAMLIFASHRLRNRIMRTPEVAMAMAKISPMLMVR